MIGKQVGNYRINLKVAQDNLGDLYHAQHIAVGQPVMMRHFAAEFTDVQPVARYLDLGRHVSGLNHPGIWGLRESVWSGRNAFIVGEPLPTGVTLDQILVRDGRLWPELTVKMGWQLAAALAAAHSASAFHCRLDGDSVYCFPDDMAPGGYRTKIMDFGVAAFLDAGTPNWRSARVEAFGLPFYMSPEQARAGLVDYRSDVYGLGCLLYHMAAGQPPFTGRSPQEITSAHAQSAPNPLQSIDPALPFELDALVQRMLTKEPAARPTMPEVALELERIAKQYWTLPTAERTVQLDLRIGAPPPVVHEEERRNPLLMAAIIMGIMAIIGIVLALTKPWARSTSAVSAAQPAAPAVAPPPPEPVRPLAPPMPKYEPPPETKLQTQLKAGNAALVEGRFADAQLALKELQKLEPKNPAVEKLARQVKSEPASKKLFDDFMKSADEKDAAKATRKLARIPADSVFAPQAKQVMEQVKKDYLHVKLAEARALAETRACKKIPPIEKQVAALFPESAEEVAAISRSCVK